MKICLLLTTLFLCLLSVSDLRTRTIPGWAAPVFGAGTSLLHLFLRDLTLLQFFAGLFPGILLLLLALIFRASLGMGDALAVTACGAAIGAERIFAALTAALVMCAVFSAVLLLLRRVKRSDCLPFLPFLAASHIVMLTAEVIL